MTISLNTEKHEIPARTSRGNPPIYPFAEMQVGDSFDAPRDLGSSKKGTDKRQNSISSSARAYSFKKTDGAAKFATRLVDENTVRTWRTA